MKIISPSAVPTLLALFLLCCGGCHSRPTMSFHEAISTGNLPEVKANMAWEWTAQANSPVDKTGMMPLHLAAMHNQPDVAEYLIRRGANVNSRGCFSWEGGTPLHVAAASGHATVAKVLLSHGARTDTLDGRGRTAAAIAAVNNNPALQTVFQQAEQAAVAKGIPAAR